MKKNTFRNLFHVSLVGVLVLVCVSFTTPTHDARAALSKRIFLTTGTSWTVPSDFSSTNTIETIGSGGDGSATSANAGGGGGAYASISNLSLTPGASVTYQIGFSSSDTVFDSTATSCAGSPTPSVCADGGTNATGGGAGGTTAISIGTTEFAGGAQGGGAGGGAAGLNGSGGAGSGGQGGTGDNGFGGAGGAPAESDVGTCLTNGGTGEAGSEYDLLPQHGSGGGGGKGLAIAGAANDCAGGDGGTYGGGGGGSTAETVQRFGGQGLIVITFTSTEVGSTSIAKFKIKGGRFLIRGGRVQIR